MALEIGKFGSLPFCKNCSPLGLRKFTSGAVSKAPALISLILGIRVTPTSSANFDFNPRYADNHAKNSGACAHMGNEIAQPDVRILYGKILNSLRKLSWFRANYRSALSGAHGTNSGEPPPADNFLGWVISPCEGREEVLRCMPMGNSDGEGELGVLDFFGRLCPPESVCSPAVRA